MITMATHRLNRALSSRASKPYKRCANAERGNHRVIIIDLRGLGTREGYENWRHGKEDFSMVMLTERVSFIREVLDIAIHVDFTQSM